MELFLVYMWLKINTFIGWSEAIAFVALAMFGVCIVNILSSGMHEYGSTQKKWDEEKGPIWKKRRAAALKILIPFASFALLMPSSTDTAILVASAVAIDVAKSPEGTKIGQLLRGKANELLDAELKKLAPQPTK